MDDIVNRVINMASEVGEIKGSLSSLKESFDDHKTETNFTLNKILLEMTAREAVASSRKEVKSNMLAWAAAISAIVSVPVTLIAGIISRH